MKKDFFDDDNFRSDSIDFDVDDREDERFTGDDDDDSFDLRKKPKKKKTRVSSPAKQKASPVKQPTAPSGNRHNAALNDDRDFDSSDADRDSIFAGQRNPSANKTTAGNKSSKNATGILMGILAVTILLCVGAGIASKISKSYRELVELMASQNTPTAPTNRRLTPTPEETSEEYTLDPIYEADPRSSLNGEIALDDEAFPDEAFRLYLSDTLDLNQDGILDWSERSGVKVVNVMHMQIQNLKGLEFFPNLEELYCSDNELTVLAPTRNVKLKVLFCDENLMNYMDLTRNTQLEELHCNYNDLYKLDVSQNKELKFLFCKNNHLDSLDVKNNTSLKELDCRKNAIRTIDATELTACRNILVDLTVIVRGENDGNSNVYRAMIDFGSAFKVQSGEPILLSSVYFPDPNFLAQVQEFDLDGDGHLSPEECDRVTSLEIDSKVVCLDGIEFFPELQDLVLNDNSISELDLSKNPKLQNVVAMDGVISKITFSEHSELKILDVSDNLLPELDVSLNPNLEVLVCHGNHLTSLDLSDNPNLTELEVDDEMDMDKLIRYQD